MPSGRGWRAPFAVPSPPTVILSPPTVILSPPTVILSPPTVILSPSKDLLRAPRPNRPRTWPLSTFGPANGACGGGATREPAAIVGETPNIAARLQELAGFNLGAHDCSIDGAG